MDVPAGLNLHMHTTVPRPADKVPDKMAESRMLFRMGFFGQRLCKSPWSEAVLFSISLAGPPMTDDDCSSNNNFLPPTSRPVSSENVLDESDMLSPWLNAVISKG